MTPRLVHPPTDNVVRGVFTDAVLAECKARAAGLRAAARIVDDRAHGLTMTAAASADAVAHLRRLAVELELLAQVIEQGGE